MKNKESNNTAKKSNKIKYSIIIDKSDKSPLKANLKAILDEKNGHIKEAPLFKQRALLQVFEVLHMIDGFSFKVKKDRKLGNKEYKKDQIVDVESRLSFAERAKSKKAQKITSNLSNPEVIKLMSKKNRTDEENQRLANLLAV